MAKKDKVFDIDRLIIRWNRGTGLNNRQIADVLEITPAYLSQLKNGWYFPSMAVIQRMADFQKVPVQVILLDLLNLEPLGMSRERDIMLRDWEARQYVVRK